MENLSMQQKIVLGVLGLIVVIILIIYVFTKENSTVYAFEGDNNLIQSANTVESSKEKIVIHIAGEVESEGIVELPVNSRVSDAINAAGGLKEEANVEQINLATILKDGQKIYIPNMDER